MLCENYVLIVIVNTVLVTQVQLKEFELNKNQVEERWSWGYFDEREPNKFKFKFKSFIFNVGYKTTTTSTEDPTTLNPQEQSTPIFCSSTYTPPGKPDFRAPGRRISEAKCMEYVWELKNRKEINDQLEECSKYITWGPSGPPLQEVGGRYTLPGEFPHMGALGWKAVIGTWVFKCGSSLISEKFVLTAAHCTKSPSDSSLADVVPKIVRIGDKNILDINTHRLPKVDATIKRIIVHPQYKPPKKYYDIALMELEHEVLFSSNAQPACLWNKFSTSELGSQALGTGWGVIESGSRDISPELQAVTVDVLNSNLCERLLMNAKNRNWHGFMDHQLCAGVLAGGVDSCQGDSGGPLQVKMNLSQDLTDAEGSMSYVIGITSFGVGCAHPNLPGIYTRVSSFLDWIEENVWPDQ